MMRWMAALAVLAVIGGAVTLYGFKEQAARLDAHIGSLRAEMDHERETINVLKAEWNYLNQPTRIQRLAERYLDLEQLDVGQLATVAELPMRPIDIDPYEGSRLGGFAGGEERVVQ